MGRFFERSDSYNDADGYRGGTANRDDRDRYYDGGQHSRRPGARDELGRRGGGGSNGGSGGGGGSNGGSGDGGGSGGGGSGGGGGGGGIRS